MKLNHVFVIISFITEHYISTKLQLKRNGFGITAGDRISKTHLVYIFLPGALYRPDLHAQKQWFFFCIFIWKECLWYSSPFPDLAEKPAEVFAQTISSACHYWCKSRALGPVASCKPAPWSTLQMACPAHCGRFYPKKTDKSHASNLLPS